MTPLRFAHQFFHFSLESWRRAFPSESAEWREMPRLFRDEIFPRRTLKDGEILSYDLARREFDRILNQEEQSGVRSVFCTEPSYPASVSEHLNPEQRPVFLHIRGKNPPPEGNALGIVGTRHPSALGIESAEEFSARFSLLGIQVISGLARGIDAIAHKESLRSGTVAVLGSGVCDVYPPQNRNLAEEILAAGGTLLSPFPLEQAPLPRNFPYRNQLIAALSLGVVVVEGAETSGAALTGKIALSQGKTVVVLPQDYRSPFGRGAIRLQEAGATAAASVEEALQALYFRLGGVPMAGLPKRSRSFSLEDFLALTGKDIPAALVQLEEGIASGKIERNGPNSYRLSRAAPHTDAKR